MSLSQVERETLDAVRADLAEVKATLASLAPLIEMAKAYVESPAGRLQRALTGRKHG